MKRGGKTSFVTFRLTEKEHFAFELAAAMAGKSLSSWLRDVGRAASCEVMQSILERPSSVVESSSDTADAAGR
jgi:hypothetical protein